MAIDARKQQRKAERRKAKEKFKRARSNAAAAKGLAERLAQCANAPILHACHTASLWDEGIGHAVLSRELRDGSIAFASFLVDAKCLGVKDAFGNIVSRALYEDRIVKGLFGNFGVVHRSAEYIRKLIEDAVSYAAGLGISPHPDYRKASAIFGDVEASDCHESFEFGKDGKPFYVAGPRDSLQRSKAIISVLRNRLGEDGFHYIVPITSRSNMDDFEALNEYEDDDE